MSQPQEPKPLAPVRRFITTHDAGGKAIWDESLPIEVDNIRAGGFAMNTAFLNQHEPHDCNDDKDLKSYKENVPEKDIFPTSGSVLRVLDLYPGYPGVLHRTGSVDYAVVMEGEVDCILDDGATRSFKRGDIIIQRGTMHAWKNNGTEIARVAAFLLPIQPIRAQGKELELHHFSDLGNCEQL